MLETVDVGIQCISCYERSAYKSDIEKLREYAKPLLGCRILHINATSYGGGVAEILRSEVPLLRDLGLKADWKIIAGDDEFFNVTKKIHNGLQGSNLTLLNNEKEIYTESSKKYAKLFEEEYDLVVIHDPQPLGILKYHGKKGSKWIWRCHIDTSEPNIEIWDFIKPYLYEYDSSVFTLGSFVPEDFPLENVEIIPPAIDPESPKNIKLNLGTARRVLEWIGVEIDKPLITQVSRFDPWKDPLGVIESYRIVKEHISDIQLALVGSMALDDPEGWKIYNQILDVSKNDPDIHIFTNLTGVGNIEVNAFQRLSSVIVQKSIREGFGLVVSESLWKETPVVAGNAGGIPLQMQGGVGGFLVNSIEECAERLLELLNNPDKASKLGKLGKKLVKKRFLLSRLISDELRLYDSLLESTKRPKDDIDNSILRSGEKDPVCGMLVNPNIALKTLFREKYYYFCSDACKQIFRKKPFGYLN